MSRSYTTTGYPPSLQTQSYEMTNTYGVAQPRDSSDAPGTAENSALLGGADRELVKRDGHATMLSCVSNLTNTIIGSGVFLI